MEGVRTLHFPGILVCISSCWCCKAEAQAMSTIVGAGRMRTGWPWQDHLDQSLSQSVCREIYTLCPVYGDSGILGLRRTVRAALLLRAVPSTSLTVAFPSKEIDTFIDSLTMPTQKSAPSSQALQEQAEHKSPTPIPFCGLGRGGHGPGHRSYAISIPTVLHLPG